MTDTLDRRRIWTFLAVAFGFTWAVDAVIWATGGLADSREIAQGITIAVPLLVISMFGPAIAVFVTRWITKEGWEDHKAHFNGPVWPWVAMWLAPVVLSVIGAVVYFVVFSDQFDASMPVMIEQIELAEEQTGQAIPLPAEILGLIQVIGALTIAPLINAVPAFGEEYGWRGYLQWKLRPMGWTKAVLATNVIWGVWHWPVIAMGHNYGTDHPGAPWAGMLMMVVFTIGVGGVLAWSAERTNSAIPAALGHGALNAIAAVGVLFLALDSDVNPLLGPAPTGIIGGAVMLAVGLWLTLRQPKPTA